MRIRGMIVGMIVMGALGLSLAAPARAEQKPDPFAQVEALLNSGVLLQGVLREEDVTVLFGHLRAALLAASQGREVPPPPEALGRRAEEIAGELKARGTVAALLLLTVFETAARQAVRPLLAAPATVPAPR
jgi:hypothetical protein